MMRARIQCSDSLIEVMIALALTAVTALGFIALQSAFARERAALIADSLVEGIRSDADRVEVVSQWRMRAGAMLSSAAIDVMDRADGVRVATMSGCANESDEPCPEPQALPHSACFSVAFAR